ncbi:copper homeostasis protein CutC [Draconibacterium sp. IB214405]|uniref:copper homeostasis protein CutC n=1 Tax=Draconibacterium sp. IB214405 TaxID=3097352 RepID=UPI002A0B42EC|nr:copper homeostasis protein CutC [Draconibacterium sp. IB214405]MDX8338667.1 copper homeostasis protein CutC [Draconibacterium sp. IB214405]
MIKEACVESFTEAKLAQEKGANRIELCSDLANDGLTPDFETMKKACSELDIPVMTMARPRAGNFVHSAEEIEQMKTAIDQAKEAGAAGIVFGLLTDENKIDEANTRLLAEYAKPLPVTFHKAIDEMENPVEGVNVLKTIPNIKRILSSGGKATAIEGQEVIRQMIAAAEGKITILVAGKVTADNVTEIQQITGTTELHGRKIVGDLTSKE